MTVNRSNLSSSLEDYLEVIYNLSKNSACARSKDISTALNVAKPSVTGALRALAEKKLINYKPYGVVTLTDLGRKNAETIVKKHDVISDFLTDILGIDKSSAQSAACQIEHTLGPQITERLKQFTDFAKSTSIENTDIAEMFKYYYQKPEKKL